MVLLVLVGWLLVNVDPVLVCNPSPLEGQKVLGGQDFGRVFCLDPLNNLELSFHLI